MDEPEHGEERPEEPPVAFPEEPQTSVHFQPVAPAPRDEPDRDDER